MKINPALVRAHRLRAETLLQLKRYDEALRSFDSYLANNGRPSAEVFKVRGLAEQRMGNYAGAIEDYTRALAIRPDDVGILTNRGWAYLINEVPRLAFRDFREVLEKDPNNADAYNGRAMARVKLGQHAAAAQDAEDAVKRGPKDSRVLYNAARVLAQAVNQLDSDKSLRGSQAAESADAIPGPGAGTAADGDRPGAARRASRFLEAVRAGRPGAQPDPAGAAVHGDGAGVWGSEGVKVQSPKSKSKVKDGSARCL